MDVKPLARVSLILALLAVLAITTTRAGAQNGACPSSTVTMGNAAGTWPGSMAACRSIDPPHGTQYSLPTLGGFPCDQAYGMYTTYLLDIDGDIDGGFFYLSPPTWSTDTVRMRFYLTPKLDLLPGIIAHRDLEPGTLTIKSYDSQGFNVATRSMSILNDSHIQIIEVPGQMQWGPYSLYLVDTYINWSTGGWLRFQFTTDEPHPQINWAVSSVQVGRYSDFNSFPAMCDIPNVGPPATPTPNWTPPPAGTPSPTPRPPGTPYPTSPPGTLYPTRTPAPVAFPTAMSEITPTPWRSYTMPSINFPSVNFPDIPPAAGIIDMGIPTTTPGDAPTLVPGGNSEVVTRIYEVREDWSGAVATSQAAAAIDDDTTGVGNPSALANVVTENVGAPISYIKALGMYMPNAAPVVGVLILMAAWVAFNVMAKPMIGIAKVLLELIRRLWEAIPLN